MGRTKLVNIVSQAQAEASSFLRTTATARPVAPRCISFVGDSGQVRAASLQCTNNKERVRV